MLFEIITEHKLLSYVDLEYSLTKAFLPFWKVLVFSLNTPSLQAAFYWKYDRDTKLFAYSLLKTYVPHRTPEYLYHFCTEIEDREEIWKALANWTLYLDTGYEILDYASEWQYKYCRFVKDREEMWRGIVRSPNPPEYICYLYCLKVKDRPELRRIIAKPTSNPEWQFRYCRNVNDHPDVWKSLASQDNRKALYYQYAYIKYVAQRPEMIDAILRSGNDHWIRQLNRLLKRRAENEC